MLALMADMHANREAFAACLADAQARGAERYIFLGDCVGYGADPCWVLDTVMEHVERGALVVRGNHDDAVLTPHHSMNDDAKAAIEWTRQQLGDAHRAFLAQLPLTMEEGERLFVHASAHDPATWPYIAGTKAAARSLAATQCRVTFCGHIHVPQLYRESESGEIAGGNAPDATGFPLLAKWRWLAVLGSVGQPRDDNPDACYALLDEERDVLTYVRVRYDIRTAAHKVRAAGLPVSLALRLKMGR
jgi:diadenosine tetraphosphatase ApaH/serine/threonine PP2A family protein phosphatase